MKSELCSRSPAHDEIKPLSIDAIVSQYNTVITNLLDKHAPVVEMAVRHRNHRPWFDEESKMTRKNVRRLERVFRRRRTTESRDEWKSALRQSRRMSRSKSSAYWKAKISDAGPDARGTWKSVNTYSVRIN